MYGLGELMLVLFLLNSNSLPKHNFGDGGLNQSSTRNSLERPTG